ncbi:hypothetical protein G7Y89_g5227 [Cudoniella acicularis]|uniref:Uncharacterized protein n=1 Tax=Cudoniella acicularis TaxID=354080 RepID=A0A8H4RR10_9HELO|nr:hypothetical protein G7Y89_g5227 [Cudoniella acicularis]
MPLHHPLRKLTTSQLLERLLGFPRSKPRIKLHQAAKQGNEEVVRKAIESRYELDEIDEHGRSALQLAASSGCCEIFAMLIEAGATLDDPLILPVSMADFCFICFRLVQHSVKGLLFAWLAPKFYIPIPSFIVRNVPVWGSAHLIAIPALYLLSIVLVSRSYPEVYSNARAIIEALSTFKGDTEYMILLFLDSEPNLDAEEMMLLWSHAVEKGYSGVCQRLLRGGFPVDSLYVHCEYPDIVTALLHACGTSHRELVFLPLSNGADPTFMDNHRRSCLLMASARPYTEHAGSIEECDAILVVEHNFFSLCPKVG